MSQNSQKLHEDDNIAVHLHTFNSTSRSTRKFFILNVKTKSVVTTDTINLWAGICKNFLKTATDKVYIHMDIKDTEIITIQQLSLVASELNTMKPFIEQRLICSIFTMSDDTYFARGIAGTLKTFFNTVYTPVRPIEFVHKKDTVQTIIEKYESTDSNDVHSICNSTLPS